MNWRRARKPLLLKNGQKAVEWRFASMSLVGHSRYFKRAQATSASHPIADIALRCTK
jgi:hypothetical protein